MPIDRRRALTLLAAALTAPAVAQTAGAQAPGMSRATAYAYSFPGLKGDAIRLIDHAGKPILIVNTASQCGFTMQYASLQELWTLYRERGLMVVGVPSNDFGNQEPGGPEDIARAAHEGFGVTFPLAAKVEVKGADSHPFYKWAALERPFEVPSWNFYKYLIGRDGRIAATFPASMDPMDPRVVAAIEKELP
jgi:glutathione peroxidase